MVYELTNMDWFFIWLCGFGIIFLASKINKVITDNRRRDYEVVLGINEVMNILAKGIMSEKHRSKTNEIIDDLINLKKQLNEES